ncbi:MAG: response regulator, partial [Phycisphaeraceae bacterium]|nr:response regulator [Phycisphaeraceae bacterium]
MNKTTTHVFVLEDDLNYLQLLQISLEKHSGIYRFTMDHRPTLEDAIEVLRRENRFDIVLTDLGLPDSDGLETLQRIQEAAPKLPVIVLSGYDDPELEMHAIHYGAQDYLVKGEVEKNILVRSINYA